MLNFTKKFFVTLLVLLFTNAIFSCSGEQKYDEWELNPNILPPTALTASLSSSGVVLSWVDNTTDEDDYRVERSLESPDNFAEIGTVAKDTSIFTDSAAATGSQYYYRIRAHSSNGVSEYSNQALVKVTENIPKYEIALAKVEIEIDVEGRDTIEVKNGKMRITHNQGSNPLDPNVQVSDWSGSSWSPKWSPYDVWELAWDSGKSNEFDMVLGELVPEEFNKIKNFRMIEAHCYSNNCGGAFVKEGSDNEIVIDDTTITGHGVYKIEFEYWYSIESGSDDEMELSMAKVIIELDSDGADTFNIFERYKMYLINNSGANPDHIKIWVYRLVDGEDEAVFPNPYYKTWPVVWSGSVSTNDFDLELTEIISGKFRRIADLEVLDSHTDGVDWTEFILNPTDMSVQVDDSAVTGHEIVKFSFEYWYMK